MPNPVHLNVRQPATAFLARGGDWEQRVTFELGSTKHVINVQPLAFSTNQIKGGNRVDLDAGRWKLTHEFRRPGSTTWEPGKGRVNGKETVARFDDGGPTEGDFDFNDVTVMLI